MMDENTTCCDPFHRSPLKLDLHGECVLPAINFHLLSHKGNLLHKTSPVHVELTAACLWSSRHGTALFFKLRPLEGIAGGFRSGSLGFEALRACYGFQAHLWKEQLTQCSTFPLRSASVVGSQRVGVIVLFIFPQCCIYSMLTVNLSGSKCPVDLSKAKA